MITLEQIQKLDAQVKKAVSRIEELKTENNDLKKKLDDYQKRIEELEILISDFKRDQGEIEQGIINALSQLEKLDTEAGGETLEAQASYDELAEEQSPRAPEAVGFNPSGEQPEEENASESEAAENEVENEEEPPDSTSELDIF